MVEEIKTNLEGAFARCVFAASVILLMVSNGFGQIKGYSSVANIDAFKKEFALQSGKVQSISCEFIQEKQLIALTESITSTGQFWFKRDNKVRIDYKKPFIYRMVMNGDKILIKDEHKENRINVKSNKLFQQVNRVMVDCIQGSILENKDFDVKVFESANRYLLELTPTGKGISDFFESIYLKVDKNDYSVESIEMNEPGGDKTLMTFTNKVLNSSLNEEVFSL